MVKFNNNGQSIIIWNDGRNGRNDLYARVYDQDYNPVKGNFQLNEVSSEYWYLQSKYIQTLSEGTFVVAFIGNDDSDSKSICLQAVSPDGEKKGGNIIVKNNFYYETFNLVMNVNSSDEIMVCWYDQYGASLRLYNKNLEAETGEKKFITYSENYFLNPLAVSIDSSLNIFVAWQKYNVQTPDNKIYGAFYDRDGNISTLPFIIDSTIYLASDIFCKNYDDNYIVIYSDYNRLNVKRNYTFDKDYTFDDRIYFYSDPFEAHIIDFKNQKLFITYNNYHNVVGFYANDNRHSTGIYNLHHYNDLNSYEYNENNSADIFDNHLIFAFEDNKTEGTNTDIWANVSEIKDVNFDREIFYRPVTSDYLYNNYPYPFNNSTKISYQLLSYHYVNLTIYDILGRVVKVLVNENQDKGIYEVNFDASNLASGIYFYRLEAFDTRVGKMILLK